MRKEKLNIKNQELREQKRQTRKTRLSKKGIYLLTLITFFLISFASTSFIIINANKLTFSGEDNSSIKDELNSLKEQVAEKDKLIEDLTSQLSAKKSSSFSPPPAETAKPKSSSTPKPSSTPSASPSETPPPRYSPAATPKPSPTTAPTATITPRPTIKPSATPAE